jgi:hypothetical protein
VHTAPPYHSFYDMVHHSRGLVPLLAGGQYYNSKFTSTIITSLVTGGWQTLSMFAWSRRKNSHMAWLATGGTVILPAPCLEE